jgi:hypothetical protein
MMLERLFPRQLDNGGYHGHWLALWLFGALMVVRAAQGVGSMINTERVITGADGIDVASFSAAAMQAFVGLFAITGMHLTVLPLIGFTALVRYRAMVPLLFLIFLLMQLAQRLLILLHPIPRSEGTPIGFYITMAMLAVTVIGLVLSLMDRRPRAD